MEDYTPPETTCLSCGLTLRVGFNHNWGITWFHKDTHKAGCENGGFPNIQEPTKQQIHEFILANPWCGQITTGPHEE